MIEAITFDLDGVYFPHGKANFIKALDSYGVSPDEAGRVFLKSEEMNHRYKLGIMSDDEYWSWAAQEWAISTTPSQLQQLLIASYATDPRVEKVVRLARQRGYKTLVCSNNFPVRVNGLHQRFGFLDNFDEAVFSYEVGATKPSPTIFTELVKRSGVPAHKIAFADDNPGNLAGAESVGITTFIYEGFDEFLAHLTSIGVAL